MSTSQSTIDYILDQLQGVGEVGARKMFGEYALYCDDRVVGLVCDDTLFVKTIMVDSAFQLKRLRTAPQGRGYRIKKRSNHVTLIVDLKK